MSQDHQFNIRVGAKLWERFKEVAKLNKEVPSALIRKLMDEYVRRHNPADPQIHLDVFKDKVEPTTMTKLCEQCDRPATYIVFLWESESKCQEHYLCDVHSKAALNGPWVRKGRRKL